MNPNSSEQKIRTRATIAASLLMFAVVSLLVWSGNSRAQQPGSRQLVQATPVKEWPGKAKRWALVIGVDQYADPQISPLKGAANDAKTLADALVRYAGFPQDQVILLSTDQPLERQPTRLNVLRRLSNLASLVPKDGLLLISFAGHGIERNSQAYLIPSDAQLSDDLAFLEESAVSVTRMRERIRATGVGQVVVLLDACRNDPGGRADAPNPLTQSYVNAFNFDVKNREVQAFVTLYATAVGQRAYEFTEKKQGYFTWAVVEGLKGGAANEKGEVTLAQLVKYVQENVPKRVAIDLGSSKQQRPFYQMEGYKAEELVIAAGGTPATVATNNPTTSSVDPAAFELSYWETIKNSTNPDDFKSYLEKYPNGQFTELARRRTGAQPGTTQPSSPAAGTNSAADQYIKAGDELGRENKWADAEIEYKLAVRLDPTNADSHNKLGFALHSQRKFSEAETEYRTALRLAPNNAESHYGVGRAMREQKKLVEAEAEIREAVRLEPINARFHAALGNTLGYAQKYAEAEAELGTAIRLEANNGEWHSALSLVLEAQKKQSEALAEAREAVRLSPKESRIRSLLARMLLSAGNYPEAEAEARETVRLDSKDSWGHWVLGTSLIDQKKDLAEAETALREAIRLTPNVGVFHKNLGVVLERQGKKAEADAEYKEAIRVDPVARAKQDEEARLTKTFKSSWGIKMAMASSFYKGMLSVSPSKIEFIFDGDQSFKAGQVMPIACPALVSAVLDNSTIRELTMSNNKFRINFGSSADAAAAFASMRGVCKTR